MGVVESASLGGADTAPAAGSNSATARDGGVIQYFGVENVDGPAPRSIPRIPVEIDDERCLKGVWPEVKEVTQRGQAVTVAETEPGGITHSSERFQYCGVQTYPGVVPDADQDNYFRYTGSPPSQ